MLFNSYVFIFAFLPITWGVWALACKVHKMRLALIALTVASLFFYSYWNPPFVLLLLFSIVFNFTLGLSLSPRISHRAFIRKTALFVGISVNLAFIGYYKYLNFFMQNVFGLFSTTWNVRDIFLPLGISFFTFQQISWLIDSYRGLVKQSAGSVAERFLEYTLFVSFFPQLIAGPIVHHGQIIPQFQNRRSFVINWHNIAIGISLFSLGLFKKVVIADSLSPWVADGFDNTDALTFIEAWAAAVSYTFQIYFDFSGYSDMAMGLGKFFNIGIPVNFNSPYKALNIIDFWRRWHMTLSQFLRDYVYIPLGGNRLGAGRRYINLLLTMLIGGLWHGAAWQFVFWGFLHGVYLVVNNLWRKLNIALPRVICWLITFTSVVVAWVFFRAESFGRAVVILKGMLGFHGIVVTERVSLILGKVGIHLNWVSQQNFHLYDIVGTPIILFCLLVFVVVMKNTQEWTQKNMQRPACWSTCVLSAAFVLAVGYLTRISEFLYFQF